MTAFNSTPARFAKTALVAGLFSIFAVTTAQAGECPADKVGANPLAGAPTAPVGVSEMELASIELAKENVHLDGRRLRFRHMEIKPGGIVPLHDHADRPALIMVVQARSTKTAASARCRSSTRPARSRANSSARSTGGRTKAR